MPWRDIGLVVVCAFVVPLFVYAAVGFLLHPADPMAYLMVLVAVVYTLTGIAVTTEAAIAARRRRADVPALVAQACATGRDRAPPEDAAVTALVVAYLPNEQDIIMESLRRLLSQTAIDPERLQVILAYNSPETLPVERELQELAESDRRLLVLRVEDSRSKAENVNAALPYVTGEITGIFDSDHHPEPLCFRKARRWLDAGYDVVQGRCTIRNSCENWLTRLIGIEFSTMYAVSHAARSFGADTALFGGSNGYWRTEVLRSLRMDAAMMTEDIDLTVRTLMAGHRIIHDRSIIATELAPDRFATWFHQRLRWAQGWHQVTLKRGRSLLRSPALNRRQKLCWGYLLIWRQVNALITPQVLPILVAAVLIQTHHDEAWYWDPYLLATTVLAFGAGVVAVIVACRHLALARAPVSVRDVVAYVGTGPAFALVSNCVALVAWLREARREREWVTTDRGSASSYASCGAAVRAAIAAWTAPVTAIGAGVGDEDEPVLPASS